MNIFLTEVNRKYLLEIVDTYRRLDGLLLVKDKIAGGNWIPAKEVIVMKDPINWICVHCGDGINEIGVCCDCNCTLPSNTGEEVLELAE